MLVYAHTSVSGRELTVADAIKKALGLEGFAEPKWPFPNAKEITQAQFLEQLAYNSFKADAYCGFQRVAPIEGEEVTGYEVRLFWLDSWQDKNCGMALLFHRHGTFDKGEPIPPRYFHWGACDHSWTEKTVGKCLHRYTCSKCSASYEVDSSD